MIFVLDNYDSFTYNLVHMLYALEPDVVVRRNRAVSVDEVLAMKPEAIVLSPGPGTGPWRLHSTTVFCGAAARNTR